MDVVTAFYGYPAIRFPRTRGDGPGSELASRAAFAFPPHARGWTAFHPLRPLDVLVSPARAGMDLDRVLRGRPVRCFPRTRGDGPEFWELVVRNGTFPPHARGWTREGVANDREHPVSPARAGMDL